MTLEEKRQLIEILMCASDNGVGGIASASYALDLHHRQVRDAARLRTEVDFFTHSYEEDCVEAAYRLIESHPALRCEWFT